METGLPIEAYLPLASFALAAGGLVVRFFAPSGTAQQTFIAAILIFLLLATGLLWRKDSELRQQVNEVAEEIVEAIGNEKLTYEEILDSLRQPDYQVTMRSIDLLIRKKRIGSEETTVVGKANKHFRIRLYFVRTF